MLLRLQIRNYAIIDELGIDFGAGLNIITGETGAGKSILMGALGLVLGNRADTSVLYEGGEKCFVEASFSAKHNNALQKLLRELELDEDETLLLRREISPNGKSRSFINDTPVNLQELKRVASLLVDLHRQFDSQVLGDDSFQFEVLDALAGNKEVLEKYQQNFQLWKKAEGEFKKLKASQANGARELDYIRFLFNELEEANLLTDELEQLESEVKRLSNADEIKSSLEQVSFALNESDPSLVQQVKQLANVISNVGAPLPELTELNDRLHSVHIELQDIAQELVRINDRIALDPQRLELANDRLSQGYKLLKKHNVSSTGALISLKTELGERLLGFDNIDELLVQKEKELAKILKEVELFSRKLSAARQKVLGPLETATNAYLEQMGMPNARLKAICELTGSSAEQPDFHSHGADQVQLLFDANKTGRFEPIEKVASGGELSRLMLAIKAQVAKSIHLPALIFDEIDTGISGEAARQVGLLMKKLSANHQVIAITHQPQIAARADAHYFVYKQESAGAVKTRLRKLDEAQRVEVIAQMLSGETLTETARQIAREMVGAG